MKNRHQHLKLVTKSFQLQHHLPTVANESLGHDLISFQESCADVNECFDILNNCHENAFCTNSEASFNCQCNTGYEGDGVTCDDIDECLQDDICPDNAICENSEGSYDCNCDGNPGFKVAKNGCVDIDECRDECYETTQETFRMGCV